MYFLLILMQLIASVTHVVAKDLTHDVAPAVILFFRSLLAALMFFIWILIRRKKLKRIEKKDIPTLIILGALNIPLNQFMFFIAIKLTTAPNVSLAYAFTPVFVLIIAIFFYREKASVPKIIGIMIAFIGIILILFERGIDFSSQYVIGNILVIFAALTWALYTVIGKEFSTKYGAMYSTGLSMITGFLMFLPIFYLLDKPFNISQISVVNWLQIGYVGIMTSGVAYALWYYALTKIEASKVAVFNNMQPVLTTILAMIFLSHQLTLPFVIGGLIIIAGVFLTQKG